MLVTGADISPTGDILALTSDGEGWRWGKSDGLMAWADFLRTGPPPCRLYRNQEEQLENSIRIVIEIGKSDGLMAWADFLRTG